MKYRNVLGKYNIVYARRVLGLNNNYFNNRISINAVTHYSFNDKTII